MKVGSLHTRSSERIHFSVFRYRWSKNGFTGPKTFQGFRETGPWKQKGKALWIQYFPHPPPPVTSNYAKQLQDISFLKDTNIWTDSEVFLALLFYFASACSTAGTCPKLIQKCFSPSGLLCSTAGTCPNFILQDLPNTDNIFTKETSRITHICTSIQEHILHLHKY